MKCWCCPARAGYIWTFKVSGNRVRLCDHCCAGWRANAAAEPDLGASRIQSLA